MRRLAKHAWRCQRGKAYNNNNNNIRQTGVAHLHFEAAEDFVHFGPLRKMLVDQPEEGAGDVGPDTL